MVYESLSFRYPEFLISSRNYPGLPHRFRTRILRAVDSTTIKLTAFNSTSVRKRPSKCIWLRGGSTKQRDVWKKDKSTAKAMACLESKTTHVRALLRGGIAPYSVCKLYQCCWGVRCFSRKSNRRCSWPISLGITEMQSDGKHE